VDAHEGSHRQIARIFRVSVSFVRRLLKRRRETGAIQPKPHHGGPPPIFGPTELERLKTIVAEHPDATLEQIKQHGGYSCSLKTIWYGLWKLKLTRKKKSIHATEQDRPEVQKKRQSFRRNLRQIEAKHLVFLDETGVTTAMTPAYARSPRGQRAYGSAPAIWETVTLITALRLDGIRSPLAFPGSMETNVFRTYVEEMLVPELSSGDVVIFDNLKPHLAAGIEETILAVGAKVLRLPPYSPDKSPIEEMYSKFKQLLRRSAARTRERLYQAIGDALRQITPDDILGWFQHAGLSATRG
jgi:transposase